MVDAFEAQRKFERMFNLLPGDMYCDDFSPVKLPRSSHPRRILNERNSIPLGYFLPTDLGKEFVRYERVGKNTLVDPVSGNIFYKKIDGKWVNQRTEEIIQVGPEKKKAISGILSGLEKSAKSDN